MKTSTNERASGTAGSLHLQVRYIGDSPEEGGGFRRSYRYQINDTDSPDGPVVGTDLYSGVGAPVDARAALATLVAFVSAAGEAYGHTMRGGQSENQHLFRRGIAEAAYMNSDELQVLAMDLEQLSTRSAQADTRSTPRPDTPTL
ncbi:hypothetical protein [Nocardioides sp. NPDC127503]|uniref:hypothetical protein n=1 Tax=Nocardioides sp. NPDC127503 TaxID=3154516 RepID=UPI00331A0B12